MIKTLLAVALGCAVTTGVCAASPSPFTSKLGMHLIGAYTPGTKKMVRARMPVLKILDTQSAMIDAARDYKKANPRGVVVLRVYHTNHYTLDQDPVERAQWHWDNVLWKSIGALSEKDRKLIDYVEAINEVGECPTWESSEATAWFTLFSIKFVELCTKAGFKPVLACIPVGNPSGKNAGLERILEFAPALRAAKKVGGAWSYHGYTLQYTKDPSVEEFYSLRYRQWYSHFNGPYADLADMPMILTEGGVDNVGNAEKDGWQARGSAAKYEDWLRWYDSQLKLDPYVIGITLYQQGACEAWKGWCSFDHEPIADWLANYWNKESATIKPGGVPSVSAPKKDELKDDAPPPPPPL